MGGPFLAAESEMPLTPHNWTPFGPLDQTVSLPGSFPIALAHLKLEVEAGLVRGGGPFPLFLRAETVLVLI